MKLLNWKDWPLTIKLPAITTFLIAVLVVLITLLSVRREQQAFRESLEEKAVSIITSTAVSSADALFFLRVRQLRNTAESVASSSEEILRVDFFNAEGIALASSFLIRFDEFTVDLFAQRVLQTEDPVLEWRGNTLIAGKSLIISGQRFGAVRIEFLTNFLDQRLVEVRNQGLILGAVTLILGAVLSYFASRTITQPITTLVEATERIARGNFAQQIPVTSSDELAQLSVAFNEMAAELQKTIARERAIVNTALEAIITIDGDGTIRYLNPAAEQVFGRGRHEARGASFASLLFPSPWREKIEEAFHQDPHAIIGAWQEVVALRKNGDVFPLELSIVSIDDEQTEMYTAVGRDITVRKQADREIKELNAALEERVKERTAQLEFANQELESFSYSVSHDLRAPLRAIEGFSRILLDDYSETLPEEAKRFQHRVRESAVRMGDLIDAVLEFSRLGRLPINKRQVNMNELAARTIESFDEQRENRQIEYKIGNLPNGYGDPRLLGQVFSNLLENALKYSNTRDVSVIEVGAKNDREKTVYFVKDNGVGFEMAFAHKLFNAFQRLHLADEFPGTGIGLANVKRIIDRHGGEIWCEAEVDKGAAFYFTL